MTDELRNYYIKPEIYILRYKEIYVGDTIKAAVTQWQNDFSTLFKLMYISEYLLALPVAKGGLRPKLPIREDPCSPVGRIMGR